MATIRILLGIICFNIAGWTHLSCWNSLVNWTSNYKEFTSTPSASHIKKSVIDEENRIIIIAKNELAVREKSGNNDGRQVEEYLRYVGFKRGEPWCAAFVSWVFGKAGYASPRTAWSPALFPSNRRSLSIEPAMIFGVYFPELKRIAHCGIVERQDGNWIITIEGNTNAIGSREGDGVYRKRRAIATIKYFANWVKKGGEQHEK